MNSTTYIQSGHSFGPCAQLHPYTANDQVLPSFRDEAPLTPPKLITVFPRNPIVSPYSVHVAVPAPDGRFALDADALAICIIWAVTHPLIHYYQWILVAVLTTSINAHYSCMISLQDVAILSTRLTTGRCSQWLLTTYRCSQCQINQFTLPIAVVTTTGAYSTSSE